MVNAFRRFERQDSGVTLVEGLIVFPTMLLAIITFINFGFGVFQWQQTGRATAIGARLAAVSNPVASNFADLTSDYDQFASVGTPVPSAVKRVTCAGAARTDGPAETLSICTGTRFDRIFFGSDGACTADVGNSVPGMCDMARTLKKENVVVSYTRDGLGYIGRDAGPVVYVTVQLRNMTFQSMFGQTDIPIRPNPVTFVGEDLATCSNPVRTAANFTSHC